MKPFEHQLTRGAGALDRMHGHKPVSDRLCFAPVSLEQLALVCVHFGPVLRPLPAPWLVELDQREAEGDSSDEAQVLYALREYVTTGALTDDRANALERSSRELVDVAREKVHALHARHYDAFLAVEARLDVVKAHWTHPDSHSAPWLFDNLRTILITYGGAATSEQVLATAYAELGSINVHVEVVYDDRLNVRLSPQILMVFEELKAFVRDFVDEPERPPLEAEPLPAPRKPRSKRRHQFTSLGRRCF